MRKLYFFGFLMLVLTVMSCKKENTQDSTGSIEFSVSLSNASSGSLLKSAAVDSSSSASAVVVTIVDSNGKTVYDNERIDLYNMNGSFISKPLSLVPGNFKLTKFMVVDKNSNVLYLTPVSGSAKASLVKNPLSIGFSVSKDITTKLSPEVVSSIGAQPQDFGYSTFGFSVVKTFNFLMGVFVYNSASQNFELTSANVTISSDSVASFTKTIKAVTDTFTVRDGQKRYILNVTKDGYLPWSDTLTASELKLYYSSADKGPLKVILQKSAFTNGLLAYFKFNHDLKDYSGNNNTAAYYGRKVYGFGHHQDTCSALDLNGSTDYVVVKNSSSLNPTKAISLCAWYYSAPFYGNGTNSLISKSEVKNGETKYQYHLSVTGSSYGQAAFCVTLAQNDAYIHTTNNAGVNTTGNGIQQGFNFNYKYFTYELYKWYFVVATYDGQSLKLYVNGDLKAWKAMTNKFETNNNDVYIGGAYNLSRPDYDFLKGRVDEARIYNRALSQDEIVQLYAEK